MHTKKTALSLGTFLLALAAPSLAQANPAIIRDFRAQAQVLPRKALAAGYRRFGGVDLGQLLAQASRVNVRVKDSVSHEQDFNRGGGIRNGAEWRPGEISLSAAAWPRMKAAAKPMLALHETLGALNYSDDNFDCSSSIWALTNPEMRATMSREEIATFESYAERGCFVARGGGGSTGVTGGGDDYNVLARMNVMKKGLAKMRGASSRQEREAGFDGIASGMYQGYGRGASKKQLRSMFDVNALTPNRPPIPETIRVFSNMEMTQEVPPGARDGWTYDARTNTIRINGRYRKKGPDENGVGFVMRSQSYRGQ